MFAFRSICFQKRCKNSFFFQKKKFFRKKVSFLIPANFKDVPDHITVELEFMFFLIFKEIVHIQSNVPEQAQELLFHQKSFHTDHLNIWIPVFTDCVIEHACIEFYRNLATATKIFIREELEYLKNVYISVTQS